MYHGFTDKQHAGIENHQGKHIHVDAFRRQIEYLNENHAVIPLNTLVDSYRTGSALPDNSVVITIDDGYASNYKLAYPVLREFEAPATIFLSTDFVENKVPLWTDRIEYAMNSTAVTHLDLAVHNSSVSLILQPHEAAIQSESLIRSMLKILSQESREDILTTLEKSLGCSLCFDDGAPEIYLPLEWKQISEMINSGVITIGSHTHNHSILTRCAPGTLREELELSKSIIEKRTGCVCTLFCYPNGSICDFDEHSKEELVNTGYLCGLTTMQGSNNRGTDMFALRRYSAKHDVVALATRVSGVEQWLSNVKASVLVKER